MYCLNCGWCCEKLSPFTESEDVPCPYLIIKDDMKVCSIYDHRPRQCKDHEFPNKFCPIGVDVLNLKTYEEALEKVRRNDLILYGV